MGTAGWSDARNQASELRKGSHRLLPFLCEPPEVVAITFSLRALSGVRRLMGVVTIVAELHGVPATTAARVTSVHSRGCAFLTASHELQQCTWTCCRTSRGRLSGPSHRTQLDLAGPRGEVERGQRLRRRVGIRRHAAHEQHLCRPAQRVLQYLHTADGVFKRGCSFCQAAQPAQDSVPESICTCVSFEFRYGTCGALCWRALITSPRALRDRLMFCASFSCWPVTPDLSTRSEPAPQARPAHSGVCDDTDWCVIRWQCTKRTSSQ